VRSLAVVAVQEVIEAGLLLGKFRAMGLGLLLQRCQRSVGRV
jgi:hypothetical protein